MAKALLIGGTGPTGPYILEGLRKRGYSVTVLHRGTHEIPEVADIPGEQPHLHSDPYDAATLARDLEGMTFDVAVVTYGRLREVAGGYQRTL